MSRAFALGREGGGRKMSSHEADKWKANEGRREEKEEEKKEM